MTYQLTLSIQENSAEARNIEALAQSEHVSCEEAALKLLASFPVIETTKASSAALRILGAFKEESALMDEALEIVMAERQRCKKADRDIFAVDCRTRGNSA